MSKSSSVSDTQSLLQSMLQRLKLQTPAERSTQGQGTSPALKLDGGSAESSSLVYQFGHSMGIKQQETPSIWTNVQSQWSLQSPTEPLSIQSVKATPEPRTPDQGLTNSSAASDVFSPTDDAVIPKWERKQLKYLQRRNMSNDSCSTLNSTDLPSPTSPTPGWTASEGHRGISGEPVGDSNDVPEKTKRLQTSRSSKRKVNDPGQKRWTQKVKERWKERHKKERDAKQKQETNVATSNLCQVPTHSNGSNTSITLTEDERIVQHQQINSGPEEAPPSLMDPLSEPMFSFGSINLMEEIFTGEEWAKFFKSNTISHSETTILTQDTMTEPCSNISQSPHRVQTSGSQWDHRDLRETPSHMNSESLQQDMDITEPSFIQTQTSDSDLLSQTFEFFKGQSEVFSFGSDQHQCMDLSLSQSESKQQINHQPQSVDTHQNLSLNTADTSVHQPLTSEQSLDQSQLSNPRCTPPERMRGDVLTLLDLSYIQPKESSSGRTQGSLNRKRGHYTLGTASSDEGRADREQEVELRDNEMISLYPLHPAPALSLSPGYSASSPPSSTHQDSTETMVKKRRVENTRQVRFSEEVVYLPPLILPEGDDDDSDDEEDEEDYEEGDDDDESDLDNEGEDGCPEPQPRSSAPNWFVALKSKTKRKSKLKLPQISSSTIKFRSSMS